MNYLKSHVGSGSSSHDLLGDFEITFFTSSCETGAKFSNLFVFVRVISSAVTAPVCNSLSELILFLIPSIFSIKKLLKLCASSSGEDDGSTASALLPVRFFAILNKVF